MLFLRHFLFFHFLCLSFAFSAFGELLIIQSSDQHSSYSRLPDFLASIEVISRQFREKHPNGTEILLINGDFSSQLEFWSDRDRSRFLDFQDYNPLAAEEKGDFAYKILSRLARKYIVLYTFGNHDAFDWRDSGLFLKQMLRLKRAGVLLLAANVDFYSEYSELFFPYVDIAGAQNKNIRFAGFTLPNSREKRVAGPKVKGPAVIRDILPIKGPLSEIIQSSGQDSQVSALILGFHLGLHKTSQIFDQVEEENTEKVSLIFAGHDHRISKGLYIHKTPIIDSGAFFDFSAVTLDDYGQRVLKKRFFNRFSQRILARKMKTGSLEHDLIRETTAFIKALEESKELHLSRKAYRGFRGVELGCVNAFSRL